MEEELVQFLEEIGVDEDTISAMKSQKLDKSTINAIPDTELSSFITTIGDRVKIREFCKKTDRKSSLLEKLKQRLGRKSEEGTSKVGKIRQCNKNAAKDSRMIQLGWIHLDNMTQKTKQVTVNNGGGKRTPRMSKDSTMADVLQQALHLYFPNDSSKLGDIQDFGYTLSDYSGEPLIETETVAELYKRTCVPQLRVYLKTWKLEIPNVRKKKKLILPNLSLNMDSADNVPWDAQSRSNVAESDVQLNSRSNITHSITPSAFDSLLAPSSSTVPLDLRSTPTNAPCETQSQSTDSVQSDAQLLSNMLFGYADNNTSQTLETQSKNNTLPPAQCNVSTHGPSNILPIPQPSSSTMEQIDRPQHTSLDMVQHAIALNIGTLGSDCDGSSFMSNDSDIVFSRFRTKSATIRRDNIFQDMLDYFITFDFDNDRDHLEVVMIDSQGRRENAEDMGGVLRDTLSVFFKLFYEKCTSGEGCMKIPTVIHNMSKEKWEAVAKIIVMGYKQTSYFPIEIALPFLEYTVHSLECASEELLNYFLEYLTQTDREIIKQGLDNFHSVDIDDILDSLSSFNVKTVVNQDNFREVLVDIAHSELIQKSSYIHHVWQPIFVEKLLPILRCSLKELYSSNALTTKKVLANLAFPRDLGYQQERAKDALKRYIKGLDHRQLQKFVQFCTGADMLVVGKIVVRFVKVDSEIFRRPVAHTCGCVLEIPCGPFGYNNYLTLREEFNNILDSGYLAMDMI